MNIKQIFLKFINVLTNNTGMKSHNYRVSTTLIAMISILLFLLLYRTELEKSLSPLTMSLLYSSLAGGGLFLVLQALSQGIKSNTSDSTGNIENVVQSLSQSLKNTQNTVNALHNAFENSQSNLLSDSEKEKLFNKTVEKVSTETVDNIFDNKFQKIEQEFKTSLRLEAIKQSIYRAVRRLEKEIYNLNLRSHANLAIGLAITVGGVIYLYDTIAMLSEQPTDNIQTFLFKTIPRLTLVIFIELFAYFFLKLYWEGMKEIKYFHNELTNLESKFIALEYAYFTDNEEAASDILKSLSNTERNHVLAKGETTVELEKAKSAKKICSRYSSALV